VISGAEALKFVRQRHGLPRGDFDRIIRQQVFIAGVLRKMLSEEVLLNLGKQRELVEATAESLTIDQSLNLLQLAEQMQTITPDSIDFQTVPYIGDDTDDQGRYILRLEDGDRLHSFFADLSAEPEPAPEAAPTTEAAPATVAPSGVTVDVLNGSGTPGLAAGAAEGLERAGFMVAGTGNADSTDYTVTEIRHAAGDEALANTLAGQVPGATVKPIDDAVRGTVQLVLGSDFTSVGQQVTTAPPAPVTKGVDPRSAADTTCIN
jgi:hypothetical protein